MIAAVVLAAGRSVRMGTQKLLLPLGSRTVIARIVDEVLAAGVGHVVVVVGPDHEELARALADRPVALTVNPRVDGDMLSSVRAGLRALPAECRGVLVVLGDQPRIGAALIRRMTDVFVADDARMVVPVFEGRRGHPLLFSARFVGEVLTGYDGEGLRGLLQAHPGEVRELSVTTADVLEDMDEPADYQRELRRPRSQH